MSEVHRNHTPHYTHLTHSTHAKHVAFTLAEVLITLAIIGIVAAMTIPNLILKYQKREFGARLAQTYSTLSNAVKMAQVEYGDISTWIYQKNYGSSVDLDEGHADSSLLIQQYVEKYFLPYLKVSKNFGYSRLRDAGYSLYITKDGRQYAGSSQSYYIIELNNGVALFFSYNGGADADNEDKFILSNPIIFVDVNSKAGPNVLGRDFYLFTLSSRKNRLMAYGEGNTYTSLYNSCKKNAGATIYSGLVCAALIQLDGWKITDDYPW